MQIQNYFSLKFFILWGGKKCKILNSKRVAEKLSFRVEPKLFEKLNFGEVV